MAKVILSSAIAFFAVITVFASAAEACISCQHVPMVARGASTSDSAKRAKRPSYSAKRGKKKRVYRSTKKRKARPAKKRVVKRKTTAKKRVVKRKAPAKKFETAKTAPIKSETDNQNSAISSASLGKSYGGCKTNGKTLSVGCVVAKSRPSKMSENLLGRLTAPQPQPNELASDRQESKTLTRGAFKNTEQ